MARRLTVLLLCLLGLAVGGAGVAAAATTAASARVATVRSAPMPATDGVDPAEKDAVTGRLGYHENRDYPYGLLVFLVVMTPVALLAIRHWTPEMEDGDGPA